MATEMRACRPALWTALAMTVVVSTSCATRIAPQAPTAIAQQRPAPAKSHISLAVRFPLSFVRQELENVIPKEFHFDTRGDARVYGTPSRGVITTSIDVPGRRLVASTNVGGRIQVEKKVVLFDASVGVDVSGKIKAAVSPVVNDWSVNPHIQVEVQVDNAVAKTAVGDINITGQVRSAIGKLADQIRGVADAKLGSSLNFKDKVSASWDKLEKVYQVAENPRTWVRLTPTKAIVGPFVYTPDSIDSSVGLEVEAEVFVQETRPDAVKRPLPSLERAEKISDNFDLSLLAAVSYDDLNNQLNTALAGTTFQLPVGSITISRVTVLPQGARLVLAVDFNGSRGTFGSVSGTLYISGAYDFDAAKKTLRFRDLQYTQETSDILLKVADWVAHSELLKKMESAAVIDLSDIVKKANESAEHQIGMLQTQMRKEAGVDLRLATTDGLRLANLVFTENQVLAVVTAHGSASIVVDR